MDARDIMTKDVIALTPHMSVDEAADVLMHHRIHGAPVVDQGQQLIGMISFMDLAAGPGENVRDAMAPDPVYASAETPVVEIAATMLDQTVRRVPIVEGGRVIGMVSASDIIRVFLNLHEDVRPASEAEERKVAGRRGRRR